METSYLPVQWIYREIAEEQIEKETKGKIFYFKEGIVSEAVGIVKVMEENRDGIFLRLDNAQAIRLDRVITLFGKPGAAYDEYYAFGNSCMDCNGGYSQNEIDEFNRKLHENN